MTRLPVFLLILAASSAYAGKFEPACPLPFSDIALSHPIDNQCDRAGSVSDPGASLQDLVKNNFCASGPTAPIVLAHLQKLQSLAVQKRLVPANNKLPSERGSLENILDGSLGEGKVVSLSGYVTNVGYGNSDTGETAHCNLAGNENNVVQLKIAEKSEADRDSHEAALAEISPHFRPAGWEAGALKSLQSKKLPMRVTGQLFFDASQTLWKIRPVYAIEVCPEKDVSLCGDGSWKRLASASAKHVIRRAISKTGH
ncbi:MAG: hypothetical protein HY074_06235 [Deltaproteobacteria bacterium]|nr:hypothetical protein [Deltaproteobacteria bacterium]